MQPDPSQPTGTDLREYIAILRHRKCSILLVTLLVTGSAVFFSLRAIPVYTSEARVQVLPAILPGTPTTTPPPINMETERGLVDSAAVATLVREELGLSDPIDGILGDLNVSVEANTEILDIAYSDPDPVVAQRTSQSFADNYLVFREQQATEQVQGQIQSVQEDIARVRQDIEDLKVEQSTADPERQSELDTLIAAGESRLGDLQNKADELAKIPDLFSAGQIVQPSQLPRSRSDAGPVRNGLVALLLGLALGVGLAFLRERLDDRLRGRDDLEQYLGHPVLAVIPRVASWRKKNKVLLVTLAQPKSSAAEAYRALRTSIQFMASKEPCKVIMVSSASGGDGKTTTSANLAVVLAQAGKRVVLVSADLRRPRVHKYFDLNNEKGLTNVMSGEHPMEEALLPTDTWNLRILTSGPTPARPAELLQSEQMGAILDDLRVGADFVIIDSAPVLVVSDALALAPIVDAVLCVTSAEDTTRQAVVRARDQLEQVGAHIIGGVLNNFDPQSARDSSYSYGYYYRYSYTGASQGGGVQPYDTGMRGRTAAPAQPTPAQPQSPQPQPRQSPQSEPEPQIQPPQPSPPQRPPAHENGDGNGSSTPVPTPVERPGTV